MLERIEKIKPIFPKPVLIDGDYYVADRYTNTEEAASALINDEYIVLADFFSDGLKILSMLRKIVFSKDKSANFAQDRINRSVYHNASNRLLVPVKNSRVALKKAPEIGWLKEFYQSSEELFLPMPQIQGLNSSWQWYLKGISFPDCKHHFNPFYGVYFPTKYEHLTLFHEWLKTYTGSKNYSADIGTGCGVLAFMLAENGFVNIYASDTNPNSIISVSQEVRKSEYSNQFTIKNESLLENCNDKFDLIVFNPPWLPADKELTIIDEAIYYKEDLFEKFFSNVGDYLNENAKIVLLFSNFANVNQLSDKHPIKEELSKNSRFLKTEFLTKSMKPKSSATKRNDRRKNELAELWVLSKK